VEQQQLRRHLLNARASLSSAQREADEHAVIEQLLHLPQLQQTCVIGSYFSVRAELPTHQLNQHLINAGHLLALPVLHPINAGHLLFLSLNQSTRWVHNQYQIPEPELHAQHIVPLQHMQLMLVPLVGFDHHGNRMGMGGGFYDRTLSGWRKGLYPSLLPIGLALDCQQVEQLPNNPWDVPLPMVITPTKVWDFRG